MNIDLQGNVLIRHQSIPDCQKCEESKKILDQNKIKYTIIGHSERRELYKESNNQIKEKISLKRKILGSI